MGGTCRGHAGCDEETAVEGAGTGEEESADAAITPASDGLARTWPSAQKRSFTPPPLPALQGEAEGAPLVFTELLGPGTQQCGGTSLGLRPHDSHAPHHYGVRFWPFAGWFFCGNAPTSPSRPCTEAPGCRGPFRAHHRERKNTRMFYL